MSESVTRCAMTAISRDRCAPILKPLGFRRASPHFWREIDGLTQCLNFQSSMYGSRDAGRFTINLGISSALFDRAMARRPASPGAGLWPFQMRLGQVMPGGGDLWWNVDASVDLDALGREVTAALRDHGLPFLDGVRTRATLLAAARQDPRLSQTTFAPLPAAILAADLGDSALARELLADALTTPRGQRLEPTIRSLAAKLDLVID